MPERHITIGIHAYEDAAGVRRTVQAIRAGTRVPHDLLLLGDGPDAQTSAALGALGHPQSSTATPLGAPAAFNRLIHSAGADLFVFLESGCVPAPGWLDALLEALDSDPRNGLAGPSTNLCWNEQSTASTADAARRLAGTFRTLEPLYSLADFCYAVTRATVDAIGDADVRYGLGPCWEMDYNIRAARAGFRGVWACGAFVERPSVPRRRRTAEAQWFEKNKRLYQDKLCGYRLRGEPHAYEPHCRGDACEQFAPPALVQIHRERPPEPLVSCVMVTRARPAYVAQAIHYFERQTWSNRELIIVYDEESDLPASLPEGVRSFRLTGPQTIGAKRNFGCEQARGDIVAQWDDDDWYGRDRLRLQAEPIVSGRADVTGLRARLFFELERWRFWTCTDPLHARIFVRDVHGGTLVYRKSTWQALARYPNASLAEDARFLDSAVRRGARLERIDDASVYIYIRHPSNSWQFQCGEFNDPRGWRQVEEPPCLGGDREFYQRRGAPAAAPAAVLHRDPLVTCIMPTADRPAFVPLAIEYFLRQHYPERELLIIDDGRSPVDHLVPADPRIRYVRLPQRHTIGAKRNMACDMANGDIILHWDDDDWMAEWRISYQVQALRRAPESAVCGLTRVLYFDARRDRAWLYVYPADAPAWIAGNTLCYRKHVAHQFRFPDLNEGEDTRFVWSLPPGSLVAHPDHSFMVAMIHDSNASPKHTFDLRWQAHPVAEIHRMMQ